VLSEIFERGKFIASKQVHFKTREKENESPKSDYIESIASELHKNTIDEITMMFQIQKKIASLKTHLAHYKLGSIFYYRNILPEALKSLQRAINLKNDFIAAHILLGKCYLKSERYEDAHNCLLQAYKINSEYPDLANTLGVALIFEKHYQKATSILQQALKKNPEFDEANFNLGVALFLSTLDDLDAQEKAIVPSRVIRFIKALKSLERYQSNEWQEMFELTLASIDDSNLTDIRKNLHHLQFKLATYIKIDPLIEAFYLKFMYGGRELTAKELASYENRILNLSESRNQFADYWNELGVLHIIQCRHLFLQAVEEFDNAVNLNENYAEAVKNVELVQNIKKGFLILLRAILK
jgi:tetratricopeptide (TPR) repeat protein